MFQAMANVERGYSFVGTTEQMELGLSVLEAALPRFFTGVQKVFKGMDKLNINKHAGMSVRSRETLEKHLSVDGDRSIHHVQTEQVQLNKTIEQKVC